MRKFLIRSLFLVLLLSAAESWALIKKDIITGKFVEKIWNPETLKFDTRELSEQELKELSEPKIEVKLPPTEAEKKYERILNACIVDKGVGLEGGYLLRALRATCEEIADDPSWFESFKYDK